MTATITIFAHPPPPPPPEPPPSPPLLGNIIGSGIMLLWVLLDEFTLIPPFLSPGGDRICRKSRFCSFIFILLIVWQQWGGLLLPPGEIYAKGLFPTKGDDLQSFSRGGKLKHEDTRASAVEDGVDNKKLGQIGKMKLGQYPLMGRKLIEFQIEKPYAFLIIKDGAFLQKRIKRCSLYSPIISKYSINTSICDALYRLCMDSMSDRGCLCHLQNNLTETVTNLQQNDDKKPQGILSKPSVLSINELVVPNPLVSSFVENYKSIHSRPGRERSFIPPSFKERVSSPSSPENLHTSFTVLLYNEVFSRPNVASGTALVKINGMDLSPKSHHTVTFHQLAKDLQWRDVFLFGHIANISIKVVCFIQQYAHRDMSDELIYVTG